MSTSATVTVSLEPDALVGAGGALIVVALVVWLILRRRRRALARRLTTAALRLETGTPVDEREQLDAIITRLERAVDRAVVRRSETSLVEARLLRAMEAIPQGVVICDENGAVVYRNRVAAAYTSARHSEALVEAAVAELLDAAVGDGTSGRRPIELFGPPRRSMIVAAYPLDDERRTVGGLAVIDDVTERRRLEAVRRDFVANISHELKTPVGALALLAETVVEEHDPVVARRLAERMMHEALRVGRTIDDLLELSRIEAEEPNARGPVPVHLVVADAVERSRSAAEQRGIRIDAAEPPGELSIFGDRRQIVSALTNLLDNATKYSERGSTVHVEVRAEGDTIEIEVRDHGVGIPARDLERIFERFYRVDRARSRETGGTGLGLAIVRHVANNHDGECRVSSREGEGSTFTLCLPIGPAGLAQPIEEILP